MLDCATIVLDRDKSLAILCCMPDCVRIMLEALLARAMRWGNRACLFYPKLVVPNKKNDNFGVGASAYAH